MDRQTEINRQRDGWMDGWMDEWMSGRKLIKEKTTHMRNWWSTKT